MQINLLDTRIKEFFKCLGWPLLFISLWFNGCTGNERAETITKVTIPAVVGKFESKKPNHEPVLIKANSPQLENIKPIYRENPLNEKLLAENEKLKNDYSKMSDSLKAKTYEKAIELNSFSSKFEDDNLKINIEGIVRGEVQEITPSYIIKEKTIPVLIKQKEMVFRLLGGIEIGNNLKLDNFSVKANLMFQNRKGNIFSGSFDTSQTIWIGYNASIFNIKR